MTIISLMDNYCPKRGLRGEHGLSLYIETLAELSNELADRVAWLSCGTRITL
jgi:hypothetical protein